MTDTQDTGAAERPRWEWAGFDVFRYGKDTELLGGLEMANIANALEDRVQVLEQQLREARALLTNRHGYCWDCGVYCGEDKVQGGHGDEPHEEFCSIGRALTASPAQPTEVQS